MTLLKYEVKLIHIAFSLGGRDFFVLVTTNPID